jgi:hypothetical protein
MNLSYTEMAILSEKKELETKILLPISDHSQNVVPAPSRGYPHTPSSASGR